MAISDRDVWEAADRLAASGQKATLGAVRAELGGGSFTTISDGMREWRRRREERSGEVQAPMPEVLAAELRHLGSAVWRAAVDLANNQLLLQAERFARERDELEVSRAEAADLAKQVSEDLEIATGRLSAADASLASSQQAAGALRDLLADATAKLAASEAHAEEKDRRISDLNQELGRINEANAELIRAIAELKVTSVGGRK